MNTQRHNARDDRDLDPEVCRRARLSRDPRFDGEFFLGVSSTGIYCRPICPARSPAERNVTYFRHAAQAASAGYRPCLRCRPESAPGSPAWRGSSTTVQRALRLINEGALNNDSVAALATRLGVGERYLRKLFLRELGISPLAVAQHQRLLFAQKLLAETRLPVTQVAFAAGFGSVRRFNSAVRDVFATTPGELRRGGGAPGHGGEIQLQLQFRPPYDWEGVLDFFARHATAGVERVVGGCYQRKLLLDGRPAQFAVAAQPGKSALLLTLRLPGQQPLMPLVARIRRMFDLDANPAVIAQVLSADPVLSGLLERFPGVRSPTTFSPFESAVRAIVGQQVSIAAARTVCARLVEACAAGGDHAAFPDAAAIGQLRDEHFPMPGRRRDSLRALCREFAGREDELDLERLSRLPGVGPWTEALVAMRGFGDPDVFPAGDLGLVKSWATAHGRLLPAVDNPPGPATDSWRPWRSYAANLLWRSLLA